MKDEKWKYAPILVSTNQERTDLIAYQAVAYAKHHKQVVIIWPMYFTKWKFCSRKYVKFAKEIDPVFYE